MILFEDIDDNDLLYLLISVLEQQTGYMRDDDIRETRYNSDGYSVYRLIQLGYAEYLPDQKTWPVSKKFKFKWTQKGKDILNNF